MAYGSLMELLNQYILSNDLGWVSNEKLEKIRVLIEETSNKLNALRKYQLNKSL
jgi:four helix bundle protein